MQRIRGRVRMLTIEEIDLERQSGILVERRRAVTEVVELDQKGNRVRCTVFREGKPHRSFWYRYSQDGRLMQVDQRGAEDRVVATTAYEYPNDEVRIGFERDPDGRLIRRTVLRRFG